MALIYTLSDNEAVHYVGCTRRQLWLRLRSHIYGACPRDGKFCAVSRWIKSLIDSGRVPIIEMVAEVDDKDGANAEQHFIWLYHNQGHMLLNREITRDGLAGRIHSLETRNKMRNSRNAYVSEHGVSEETRKKLGDNSRGRKVSLETREKMSIARTGRRHSEASKQKMRISQTGHACSEATRQKIREKALERSANKRKSE